ncbi:MAG: apolipoprotein D and lipocalin family protein [Candidatus Azotimanducaceae bacterium]|jgi:apolipoprotein D and lipocalin family protein
MSLSRIKVRLILLVLFSITGLVGCSSAGPFDSIRTQGFVDLDRFSGDWYVIASIPTVLEKDAFNAVETYEKPVDGRVATTFRFNKGALDGPEKIYHPTGFVRDASSNAVWGMQFIWPIKAEYRIVYVDEPYDVTIIGRSKRDYVWIMARTSSIPDTQYQSLLNIVRAEGYDLSAIRKVPHSRPE